MLCLSILIPVYNWSITSLISCLIAQIAESHDEVDIHLFDDASCDQFSAEIKAQEEIAALHGVKLCVYRPALNVGRAAARNELLSRSRGDLVLFLDADVVPDSPNFLQTYLDAARAGAEVVCGGVSYRQCTVVSPRERFYYRYSSKASVAPAELRNRCKWLWIFTANMMVLRNVMKAVPFDQTFVGYGYEDIEWGVRLDRYASILHIDNTVTHLGLLSKEVLQRKMREAAPNFVRMWRLHPKILEGMKLAVAAKRVTYFPRLFLIGAADLMGWMFLHNIFGFKFELMLFQLEKVLRTAVAFQEQ